MHTLPATKRSPAAWAVGSVIDAIDWTPIVRLSRMSRGSSCTPLAKCAFMSPLGAVDVRAAVRMLRTAEAKQRLRPGDTIIEPTRGDTAVGLAIAAAAAGYQLVVVMPERVAPGHDAVLQSLGAWVMRTPAGAPADAPEGYLGAARRLCRLLPGAHLLENWAGPSTPRAYEALLAREILHQCGDRLDAVIVPTRVRGDLHGVGRIMRAQRSQIQVVTVELVDGDGLEPSAEPWAMRCGLERALAVARRLAHEEGLLVGPLSGAAAAAA